MESDRFPSADQALFSGEIEVLIATCYQNERPLAGLAGLLDWRFQGEVTSFVRNGMITGKIGECVYLPYSRFGKTYRVLLVGAGHSNSPGERSTPPAESIRALSKNLAALNFKKVGVSRADMGNLTDDQIRKHFSHGNSKGDSIWIGP